MSEANFYILLEFQSTIDYRMPLRLLFYMCEILRDYAKNKNHKKYDKDMKIPAVIPLVLYNGQQIWDVPNEFRKIIYNENLFGNELLNYKYEVFDVNNDFSKEELLNSKNVTSAIFLLDQKIDALEFLQRIKAIALFFDSLTNTEIIAIKHWIKNTVEDRLAESAIKILESKKEDVELMVANNAFILSEMKEKAIQEGIEKGIEQGIEKGIQAGKIISKREDIIENLCDLGEVSSQLLDLINNEENLQKLKEWLKLSIKCESIDEFINSTTI